MTPAEAAGWSLGDAFLVGVALGMVLGFCISAFLYGMGWLRVPDFSNEDYHK